MLGAGGFAAGTLVPAIAATGGTRLVSISSARGFSARHLAEKFKFESATTDSDSLLNHPDIDAVFVVTRHDLHARQAAQALKAGKHVFVEKPLAIDRPGLAEVLAAQASSGKVLAVGFNRRFSPLARELAEFFEKRQTPLVMHYRVNAGPLPPQHWVNSSAVGEQSRTASRREMIFGDGRLRVRSGVEPLTYRGIAA